MIDAGRTTRRSFGRGRRGAAGRRRGGDARRLRLPRPSPRVLLALIAAALLFGAGWLWFRDSSLVSVNRVTVVGASGPDTGQIRRALIVAARNMTTLDVSMSALRTAVAPYPVVKDVRVSTQFPHGMRITVIEQIPVAAVVVSGQTIAVAGDGTLLPNASGVGPLPRIPVPVPPGGARLTGSALDAVTVLAAAPYQMLAQVTQLTSSDKHGLTAQLRNGPSIYFGDTQRLAAKWTAAVAVLADASSAGALYIDVSDPGRPAAGGGPSNPASSAANAAGTTTPTTQTAVPPGG